ncbi:energy-coupling factor transport system permease protein [Desulfonispora thiosulfatigenes DSM 11270]|uniref:Energy-coupling factor transporter transmembrane protein EcfT n=1 Tax=Desulfonispora thiosulfatigenes DSM 11270 TaxID=656914 RepID=A0A1W1USC4_DESTI|nr:energy-coupling factor transporter transmembrane protein EcfT [Desulfonispora thiosulfatigenes]SMB83634.1 energy-coupling factor transport system permease protein [Desulfonispora thiosulfatigenes DSM 11270]
MLKNITIGQYFPGNSPIHKLDPRTKILSIVFYMISLFIINNFTGYLYTVVFSIIIILLSQIPVKLYIKGLKPLILIIILAVSLNIFMTPGTVIYKYGFLKVTEEGLRQGIFMGTRLILLVTVTSVLTLTTTPISLTDGIESILKPFKKFGVPAHELAMMMSIALRFIPTLIEETEKIMKAQMARGADFESGNLIRRAKALVPLLVPLFLGAFRRADDLAMAMEARCYRGGDNRTRMKQLNYSNLDFITFFIILFFFVFSIYTRWF